MKERILKLCRRLKSCTLDDLIQLTETDKETISLNILYLGQEGLIQTKNELIIINHTKMPKDDIANKNLNLMFQYRTPEEADIILKSFCLGIPPQKLCHLINVKEKCTCDYYCIFRKLIYERQFKGLLNLFFEKPQIGRYRKFYEKYAYFYIYNNQVYVSDKLLKHTKVEKNFNKTAIREFKKVYSYLTRVESHNINENYMYFRLAECIWRRNKSFEELFNDLKFNLLNTF